MAPCYDVSPSRAVFIKASPNPHCAPRRSITVNSVHHDRLLERRDSTQGYYFPCNPFSQSHSFQVLNVIVYILFLGLNISTIPDGVYTQGKQTYITPAPWAFLIWSVHMHLSSTRLYTLIQVIDPPPPFGYHHLSIYP